MCKKFSLTWSFLFLITLTAFIANAGTLRGQSTKGTIAGTLTDESGGVLPGAEVLITNQETGNSQSVLTEVDGRYVFPIVEPGNYVLRASLSGFRTVERSFRVSVGAGLIVDLKLKVGEISEVLEVSGEVELVERSTSSLSGLVEERTIRDLPLNGRSWEQLAALSPGVASVAVATQGTTYGGAGKKLSIGGSRPNQNAFLLDGTDINDFFNSTPGSVGGNLLGADTIQEFRVVSDNYSAEYGRMAGGVVNAVTKSGGNDVHGSLFYFHRNDQLDARNFFDRGEQPEFKRHQFGATLGGPIRKDKTFFFAAYEGFREGLGVSRTSFVPSLAVRSGEVPGVGRVNIHSAVLPFLKAFPEPNGRVLAGGTAEYFWAFTNRLEENYFQGRLDQIFSEQDSLFGRYTFDDADFIKAQSYPEIPQVDRSRNQYFTLEEKHTFGARLLNIARVGFSRTLSSSENEFDVPSLAGLALIPGRKVTNLSIPGVTTFGGNSIFPVIFIQNLYEYADDLTWLKREHSFKFGASFKRIHYNTITSSFFTNGQYNFNSLQTFLEGRPFLFNGASLNSDPSRMLRHFLLGVYLQDDWTVSPKLTLNLGLRFESYGVPWEVHGRLCNLRNITDTQTTCGKPFFENPARAAFAPRVGFAWQMAESTVLRGGFGVFHDHIFGATLGTPITLQPPTFTITEIPNPVFPNAFFADFKANPLHIQPMDPKPGKPYVMHWNLNIQRQLLPSLALTIGYGGSRGIHLPRSINHNVALKKRTIVDGRVFFPVTTPSDILNPVFGVMRAKHLSADSIYNSLRIGVTKRYSAGLNFQVSYAWSRNIDTGTGVNGNDFRSGDASIQDPYCHACERAISDFNISHVFSTNLSYELPIGPGKALLGDGGTASHILGGWAISTIVSVASGFPVNIRHSAQRARDQSFDRSQRPDLVSGFSTNPVLGGPEQYFDPTAFALPALGYYGNLGRNTLIGPGLATIDFSLMKNISVRDTARIQVRGEFFNLLNRANFDVPARIIFDGGGNRIGSAGRITQTLTSSRQIQLGLKIIF